jgi:hypothetical protein
MEESEEMVVAQDAMAEHQAEVKEAGHVELNEGRNQKIGSVGIFAKSLKFGMNPNLGKIGGAV